MGHGGHRVQPARVAAEHDGVLGEGVGPWAPRAFTSALDTPRCAGQREDGGVGRGGRGANRHSQEARAVGHRPSGRAHARARARYRAPHPGSPLAGPAVEPARAARHRVLLRRLIHLSVRAAAGRRWACVGPHYVACRARAAGTCEAPRTWRRSVQAVSGPARSRPRAAPARRHASVPCSGRIARALEPLQPVLARVRSRGPSARLGHTGPRPPGLASASLTPAGPLSVRSARRRANARWSTRTWSEYRPSTGAPRPSTSSSRAQRTAT
jgi:hypothetical protein